MAPWPGRPDLPRAPAQASNVPVSDENIKEMVHLMDMDEDGERGITAE